MDPLAESFLHESTYTYAGNNPVYFIDIEGKYKYTAEFVKEYSENYSCVRRYLENYIQGDVLASNIILEAFLEFSEGNLTREEVTKTTTWGEGPTLLFVEGAGNFGLYNEKHNDIIINSSVLDVLENALEQDDIEAALFNFYGLILHETVHHGDYLDGGQSDYEVGEAFFQAVFAGTYVDDYFIQDFYNTGSCNHNCNNGNDDEYWKVDDNILLRESNRLIRQKLNKNIFNTNTHQITYDSFPTVPDNF